MRIGGAPARRLTLQGPKAYHLPTWKGMSDPRRVATLRKIVLEYGRDPRVATLAVQIIRGDKGVWTKTPLPGAAEPRDYKTQASLILTWVQHHVYYVNEPGERLQSPEYTLRVGYGDCDDLAILVASLYESIRLPWRFVLSGVNRAGKHVRWIEGTPLPRGVSWAHIYIVVGRPPFKPKLWDFAEPTLKGVPLGWDVVNAKLRGEKIPVPELGGMFAAVYGSPPYGASESENNSLSSQFKQIQRELAEELHWRKVLVTAIVGAVATASTGFALKYGSDLWRKARTKKRRSRRRRQR